jgi:hypothetical protein
MHQIDPLKIIAIGLCFLSNELLLVPARYTFYPGVGYYKMYNSSSSHMTFHEAYYNCSTDGGHLAIINSQEEANLFKQLWTTFPTGGSFIYVGFNDLLKAGDFRTIFGK